MNPIFPPSSPLFFHVYCPLGLASRAWTREIQTNSVAAHGFVRRKAALCSRWFFFARLLSRGSNICKSWQEEKENGEVFVRQSPHWLLFICTNPNRTVRIHVNCFSVRRLFDRHLWLWELHSQLSFNEFIKILVLHVFGLFPEKECSFTLIARCCMLLRLLLHVATSVSRAETFNQSPASLLFTIN